MNKTVSFIRQIAAVPIRNLRFFRTAVIKIFGQDEPTLRVNGVWKTPEGKVETGSVVLPGYIESNLAAAANNAIADAAPKVREILRHVPEQPGKGISEIVRISVCLCTHPIS